MIATPKEIEFYKTAEGRAPFREWIEALKDRRGRNAILTRLDRVQLGNMGDHKAVGSGVYELRVDFGPGYRVYFGLDGATLVILLCGGDKSTQDADICKAIDYWTDYRS